MLWTVVGRYEDPKKHFLARNYIIMSPKPLPGLCPWSGLDPAGGLPSPLCSSRKSFKKPWGYNAKCIGGRHFARTPLGSLLRSHSQIRSGDPLAGVDRGMGKEKEGKARKGGRRGKEGGKKVERRIAFLPTWELCSRLIKNLQPRT